MGDFLLPPHATRCSGPRAKLEPLVSIADGIVARGHCARLAPPYCSPSFTASLTACLSWANTGWPWTLLGFANRCAYQCGPKIPIGRECCVSSQTPIRAAVSFGAPVGKAALAWQVEQTKSAP